MMNTAARKRETGRNCHVIMKRQQASSKDNLHNVMCRKRRPSESPPYSASALTDALLRKTHFPKTQNPTELIHVLQVC